MRTIITTPDYTGDPTAHDATVDYIADVAESVADGNTSGHTDAEHHWTTETDADALVPDPLVLAFASTGHYGWQAVGRTREECDHALLLAYALHVAGEGTIAEPDLMAQSIADGEVNYVKLRPGEAARDGSPLTMPPCQDVSQAGRPRLVAEALTGRPADSSSGVADGATGMCSVCGEPWTAYGMDSRGAVLVHDTDPGDFEHHDVRPVAQGDRLLTWDECEAAKVDPTRGHPSGRQWLASDVAAVWDRVQDEARRTPEYDWTDEAPCIAAGRHRPTQRHARHECTIDPEPATDDE